MFRRIGILLLIIAASCISASESISPQKPLFPLDQPGTTVLPPDNHAETLQKLLVTPTASEDPRFRTFKLAYLYFSLENYSTALTLLRTVIDSTPELIPAAYIYIAEIEEKLGRPANALAAYRTVLRGNIPQRFRNYIFKKLHEMLKNDSTISLEDAPWLEEYFHWQPAADEFVSDFTVDSIIASCDRGNFTLADSLLQNSVLSGKYGCLFISYADSTQHIDKLSIKSVMKCAQLAHTCGSLPFSEKLYEKVKKRTHYTDSIPEKLFLHDYAELLFDRGDWHGCIKLYKKYITRFGNDADVIFSIARAYRKLDRNSDAAVWYDRLMATYPRHPKTEEILWLRAWQNEDRGDYAAAGTYYKTIYNRRKKGSRLDESYVRHALCYYRLAKFDSALVLLDRFDDLLPNSSLGTTATFWRAKVYLAQGKTNDALMHLRLLSYKDPFDYYAHRARQVLATLNDTPAVSIDTTISQSEVVTWFDSLSRRSDQKKELSKADSASLLCGNFLAMVGDIEKADFFIEPVELGFPGNLTLQYKLITLYNAAGATAQAYRIARRLTWRIPQECKAELPLAVYSLFYPPFYSEYIIPEARKYQVDPCLISGIIRQESIFNPKIVSPAGAVGLMQIMPYTGKVLAKKVDVPFATDSLYQPFYNLRFGIYYINELLQQYEGNPMLALAGYNAGPHNASRWYKQNKDKELDLFVEDVGFSETRGYVKKVMANYWTYQILAKYPSYNYKKVLPKNTPPIISTSENDSH